MSDMFNENRHDTEDTISRIQAITAVCGVLFSVVMVVGVATTVYIAVHFILKFW